MKMRIYEEKILKMIRSDGKIHRSLFDDDEDQ
jgi:hypothetical protein